MYNLITKLAIINVEREIREPYIINFITFFKNLKGFS